MGGRHYSHECEVVALNYLTSLLSLAESFSRSSIEGDDILAEYTVEK